MNYIKRRLFVGIGVSPFVQKKLAKEVEGFGKDLVIPTQPENFHITLCLLGFILEDEIPTLCEALEVAAARARSFEVSFSAIEVMDSLENPKNIWLTGEANEDLRKLHQEVEKALGIFVTERKSYRPHITLAKIKKAKWLLAAADDQAALPKIKERLHITDPVETITLFESASIDGKRIYDPLATFMLGE
jgi:2'-5' RNA ligase